MKGKNQSVASAFPLSTGKDPGYSPEAVDRFLQRARASYEQAPSSKPLTSREIREMAFPLKRRGYAARFVDAALDRLEEVFFERETRLRVEAIGEDIWWDEIRQLLSEVRGRLARPAGKRLKRCGFFAVGYRISEVDAFLDRINAMLLGQQSLNVSEIRGAVFHSQWRGYGEDQVDALLDSVIVLLLSTR